jgi:tetratricopeptide (TPR) repeat protein
MTRPRRPRRPDKTARPAEPRQNKRFFGPAALVFVVALAVRLLHVWQIRSAPFFTALMGDAHGYDEWARRIAGGEWIGSEVFYQAPLYPYFLGVLYATMGHSLLAVRVVQAVVGSISCLLVALTGQRLFSSRVGLIGGLGLALYAPAIFFDGVIQKSVLDVFFVSLALWLLSGLVDRPSNLRGWLALGIALGGLSLTRENALVLIVVIALWGIWRLSGSRLWAVGSGPKDAEPKPKAQSLRPIGVFAAGLAIVLLPVALRNYAVGGGFYLTTAQFGPNFYIGNNPSADGTYVSLRYGRGAPEYERQDATDMAQRAVGRALSPGEVSSYWTGRALSYITSQPVAWLRLMLRKFVLLWNRTEAVDTESQETYAEYSMPLAVLGWIGHFGVLVPLALVGGWAAWSDRRRLAVFYALTLTYAASVLLFYVFARYRFPLVPLLMLFAANGVWYVGRVLLDPAARRVQKNPPYIPLAALVVVLVFTNWPVLSAESMQAVTENNLAIALQDEGRLDDAVAHYRRAIALDPRYAPAYNNLGVVLRRTGKTDEAIASYEHALSIQHDYANAEYNLANALMDKGRTEEAVKYLSAAAAASPDSADVFNNLGVARANQGNIQDAIAAFEHALQIDPKSAFAERNLGDMLDTAGRPGEALPHLRRAVELDPKDGTLHYALGRQLLAQKDLGGAIDELRQAVALQPDLAEAHNDLGAALMFQGKPEEAMKEFQTALRIQPDSEDAQRNLAAVTAALRRR